MTRCASSASLWTTSRYSEPMRKSCAHEILRHPRARHRRTGIQNMLPAFDHRIAHCEVERFGIDRRIQVQPFHAPLDGDALVSLTNAVPTPLRAAGGGT